MPLTISDLAAAAVAENREEMVSAVNDLIRGLGVAAQPLNHPSAPFRLNQAAMKGALFSVCVFFRKFGDIEAAGLNWPLEMLLIALLDLEGGTQPALLKPRRAGHAPPMSYAKQVLAFHAASALDELMNLGLSRAAGAQAVAQQIKLAGIPLTGRKPVTARLVISWRDRFHAGSDAMPDFMVEIWRRQPARKPSAPGLRPGSPAARIVLRHFRQKVERLAANLKT